MPKRIKAKESECFHFITAKFGAENFEYNRFLEGSVSCIRLYPDFLFTFERHTLIVELDEYQHRDRNKQCEDARVVRIQETLNRPLIIIRLNPDAYTNNKGGKIPSCFKMNMKIGCQVIKPEMQTEWSARLETLERQIRKSFEYPVDGTPITTVKLYYDGYEDLGSIINSKRKREISK